MVEENEWLNRKDASKYLHSIGCPVSPKTLANLASNNNEGKGPPFVRFRWNRVSYRRIELKLWADCESERIA
jgi:hypothetical protein